MKRSLIICRSLLALLAAAALFAAGCRGSSGRTDDPEHGSTAVIDIPAVTSPIETAVTPEPTAAPTAEPTSTEGRILAGAIYPLNGGEPVKKGWEGEDIDIDGDGIPEALRILMLDGGYTFCIDGEAFLTDGNIIRLASLDGKNIVFVTERPGEDGYNIFYPDPDGNLYCRLFAIARSGNSADLVIRSSFEEYIEHGLDIMLHNPMLYSVSEGAVRGIYLDMDGDGERDEIVFDSEVLSINGSDNAQILLTTMPRFIYDKDHGCIVLYGSAGDYALRLRLDRGELVSDISYATLL